MSSIYSVTQVNSYIKMMFTQDFALSNIYIKGEVSNCKYHSSGHIYFTLKDNKSVIAVIMFAGNRSGLKFKMAEGQTVVACGSISVYERDGKYQLYAKEILLDGAGVLYQQFEELKIKLEEMGMFAHEYKKTIPKFANHIGIVTAKTGAVIQDIINVAKRRNPYVNLTLYPAKVQGDGAALSIIRGIEYLDKMGLDVIIIGRGGGSIEDLWAFNEESVARAIFNCQTPIISAVGHETDTTIADYVADLRAPTPSAASEIAVFDYYLFEKQLVDVQYTMFKILNNQLLYKKEKLNQAKMRLKYLSPANQILQRKQYVADLEIKLQEMMLKKIKDQKHRLSIFCEKLNGLSPLTRLSKGFAFVTNEQQKPVIHIEDIQVNDKLNVQLQDGKIITKVIEVVKRGENNV